MISAALTVRAREKKKKIPSARRWVSPGACWRTGSCPSRSPSHTSARAAWLPPSPGPSTHHQFSCHRLTQGGQKVTDERGRTWKALTIVRWSLLEFLDRVLRLMSATFSLPCERRAEIKNRFLAAINLHLKAERSVSERLCRRQRRLSCRRPLPWG